MRTSPSHVTPPQHALRRVAPGVGVAILAAVLAATPVAAATYKVKMNDGYAFQPKTRTIARGDTVKWKNNASFSDHDVKSTTPNGYFSSGGKGSIDPGESYTRAFRSAGTYKYVCLEHSVEGMKGKVKVPMKATRDGNRFKLKVASMTAESGYRHEIFIDRPGPSGWQRLVYTTGAVYYFTPTSSGTYKFKSRLQDNAGLYNGQTSKFSPVVSITN